MANRLNPPASSSDHHLLPSEWEVKQSKSKGGKMYYYNKVTGVSTWKRPLPASEVKKPQVKSRDKGENANTQKSRKRQSEVKQPEASVHPSPQKKHRDTTSVASSDYSHLTAEEAAIVIGYSPSKKEAPSAAACSGNPLFSTKSVKRKQIPSEPKIKEGSTGPLQITQASLSSQSAESIQTSVAESFKTRPHKTAKRRANTALKKGSNAVEQGSEISVCIVEGSIENSSYNVDVEDTAKVSSRVKAKRGTRQRRSAIPDAETDSKVSSTLEPVAKSCRKSDISSDWTTVGGAASVTNSPGTSNSNSNINKHIQDASISDRSRHKEVSKNISVPSHVPENTFATKFSFDTSPRNSASADFSSISQPAVHENRDAVGIHTVQMGNESVKHSENYCTRNNNYVSSFDLTCQTKQSCLQESTPPYRSNVSPLLRVDNRTPDTTTGLPSYNISQASFPSDVICQKHGAMLQATTSFVRVTNTSSEVHSNVNREDSRSKVMSSLNGNSTSFSSSPSATSGSLAFDHIRENEEVMERDIEDMDVDEEGIMLLSNLQDVRGQTSLMLNEPGALTEAVTKANFSKILNDNIESSLKTQKVVLVIDTNVLISCLRFLRDVLNYNIPGHGQPMLVLPWVVMQELDYLKNAKGSINNFSKSTSQRAAEAVKFIHAQLTAKNPCLVGQTPQEANEETDLPIECNDDRILQCCLQCAKKYHDSQVVLLTRDINLINKALIMGIEAASNETLWSHLNVKKPDFNKRQSSFQEESLSKENLNQNLKTGTSTESNTDLENGFRMISSMKSSAPLNQGTETIPCAECALPSPSSKPVNSTLSKISAQLQETLDKKSMSSQLRLDNKDNLNETGLNKSLPQLATPTQSKFEQSSLVGTERADMSKGADGPETAPQSPKGETSVMKKFETVWKLIFDVKLQVNSIITQGKSHANYMDAVQMLKTMRPLLSQLKDSFERCLSLSPVVLCEHKTEFDMLSSCLNTFFTKAGVSSTDISKPVVASQLITHFHQTRNRPTLLTGLEQLSAFVSDFQTMLEQSS